MTDLTDTSAATDIKEEPGNEDPRGQSHDRIAELLAELSEAADLPDGVSAASQFAAGEVSFSSDAWMSRLADVQGWLRFDDELSATDPASFLASLASALGFENATGGIEIVDEHARLTEVALERLSERAELAARLQQRFLADLDAEGSSQSSATATWSEAWETEEDVAEAVTPEPVTARADVWPISQLTGRKLNLVPSYQRGDVWRTGDRQALIESILRGIPLPSVILLRTGAATPHEVVDGKQRLTAILRFVGKHPVALAKVAEAEDLHPEAELKTLFTKDYPSFRTTWRNVMGYPLTAKLEDEFYFPFKLRNDAKGGLVGADLEPLRGKYFTQIRENIINVADESVTIKDLFEAVVAYKVPVLEYTKATQRQIHEVFKLYNKQGMHLNAEEIRNAVYHDVELTRAILVAAGDASSRTSVDDVAPSLVGVPGVDALGKTLAEYGFGEARYRRTKVLGWILSALLNDTHGKLLPSTARHTDLLLSQVQEQETHPLREPSRIADLFEWVAEAGDLHAAHEELWPDKFRGDGRTSKWQDLQLVGSFIGIAIATAGSPTDVEDRIEAHADTIREAALHEWFRPKKTQTRTQWDYIGRIARGVVEILDVDITAASDAIRIRFGSSGVESLLGSIQAKTE
ncbi:DUF262 domain-containing protein [Microbacterium sp. LMC-P-041]|uniref:DUF262 domain-containing protein n=1 Tax=Microbacterium sp. LMC-P-041 TaxID=3040293 RepID=UPI0025549E81|nr:DUF262 domain-containing protein [Microbacterium sp. LMC-P-041]